MIIKDGKDILEFLKQNKLDFKYWKEQDGLYDIHIFNLRLLSFSFADYENSIEINFIIENSDFNFLQIFKTSSNIEIIIGKVDTYNKIELKNARIRYDRIEGLEILWREEK